LRLPLPWEWHFLKTNKKKDYANIIINAYALPYFVNVMMDEFVESLV
jgi:hypothetical protein